MFPLIRLCLFCLPLTAALAGCNDPGFRGVSGVRTAEAHEVVSCTRLVTIRTRPDVYGPLLADQGLTYARNRVLDDARKAGANTVVFDKVTPGEPVFEVTAQAYRC